MLKQARLLARAMRHDVRLAVDYARLARQPPVSLAIAPELLGEPVLTPEEAVRLVEDTLGAPPTPGPALALVEADGVRRARQVDALAGSAVAGDPLLGRLLYALGRALRPGLALETGVGPGLTSAYLLAALADNAEGELHSIDLPISTLAESVGWAVPPALRPRWEYHWGATRRILARVLASLGSGLRLAMLDGDLGYATVRWELEHVWHALEPGGWVVTNEAQAHTALRDLAASVGRTAVYARQATKPGWTGLLVK